MSSERGRKVHGEAERARERGESLEALKIYDEATLVYQEDGDMLGLAEVQSARQLTFGHLHDKTGDSVFLILGKYAAMSAVEIAEKYGEPESLALPYERLGQAHEALGELDQAIEYYKKAVEASKSLSEFHDNNSVRAEIRSRLATAELKNGDESALERALKTIDEINEKEVGKYVRDVWVSGVYMRIAEATNSKEYLEKAKEIVNKNEELELRKRQLEKLSEKLGF